VLDVLEMATREGKGWAKGRTAATDPRVARYAQGHRGRTYTRRVPPSQDRRYRDGSIRTLPLEWSAAMAYVVGLIATDGSLSKDGRHIQFDSGDPELVETFLSCLGRKIRYRTKRGMKGGACYQAQFSDVRFYRWLQGVGLMQRKSLVLGAIAVPDEHVFPLLRGLFEGDGHIHNFTHRPTKRTYPDYAYERLWVFFNSASRSHLEWIREQVAGQLGIRGYLEQLKPQPGRHEFFRLKFGKYASIKLLRAMYPDPSVPMLERKWKIWADYEERHGLRGA
jgi:hypothetical protein